MCDPDPRLLSPVNGPNYTGGVRGRSEHRTVRLFWMFWRDLRVLAVLVLKRCLGPRRAFVAGVSRADTVRLPCGVTQDTRRTRRERAGGPSSIRSAYFGATQLKLLASFRSPDPSYIGTCGCGQSGR